MATRDVFLAEPDVSKVWFTFTKFFLVRYELYALLQISALKHGYLDQPFHVSRDPHFPFLAGMVMPKDAVCFSCYSLKLDEGFQQFV